jgi:hypothetical protein
MAKLEQKMLKNGNDCGNKFQSGWSGKFMSLLTF